MLIKDNYTHDDVSEIIKSISTGVSSSSGEEFFEKLVLHLWKLYGMSHILIGTFNENENSVTTLKFCVNGKIEDNITYSLEYSPCAQVIKDKSAVFTKNVQDNFEEDEFFKQNNIESYLGIRLVDSVSTGIGILSCLDTKELIYPDTMHSILEIFASRASAEIERQKAEQNLEKNIQKRTKELEDALALIKEQSCDQLIESEKMAALGSMVAGFTHDLNTPIGISVTASSYIRSESENMKRKINEEQLSKSALLEFVNNSFAMSDSMYKNLEKARELIKSFKLISIDQHIEDEKQIFLKSYLDDILLSLHYKIKHTQIHIENKIPIDLELYASGGVFFQIFGNLILNSIKHGFDEIKEGKIIINASLKDGVLDISYKDSGKGMDKETKDKIFDQFFTTKKDDGGTGLGMFTIYELVVNRCNGEIEVISEPNEGVEFKIKMSLKS